MTRMTSLLAMIAVLSASSVALAEKYYIPGRDFHGTTPETADVAMIWPAFGSAGVKSVTANAWVSIPHPTTDNGITVTVYGRFEQTGVIQPRCRLWGTALDGTVTGFALVPSPPVALGPFSMTMSMTQSELNNSPFVIMHCEIVQGQWLYGAVVNFNRP